MRSEGPWRFAYDDQAERPFVERVMRMLKDEPPKRKRVYVLIGNEPIAACLERLNEIISWGGEPHAQPYIKLNALEKRPHFRFDWTEQTLRDMARWANRRHWRYTEFEGYWRGISCWLYGYAKPQQSRHPNRRLSRRYSFAARRA
jgi:hypothetical protein